MSPASPCHRNTPSAAAHCYSKQAAALPLANTLTLIPGGTRGIGLATAKLFARNGSRVVVLGRDQERIKHVLEKELAPIHGSNSSVEHLGFQCDVSNQEDIERTIKELGKVAPVDYMVNSAGITRDSLLIAHASQDIENVISTNLMGTIWLNKAVVKGMMRRKRGSIINISSVVGLQGNIGQSVYSASKSAIIGTQGANEVSLSKWWTEKRFEGVLD
ncbi:reductase [Linnemannia hyalina]|uniref:Reductase n=1 Tax=Linnemannia hyalina TaxID=64524 RepID=A0A9P7XQJ8_9FUNG|nr:reductase [Linnemannia hyalina]